MELKKLDGSFSVCKVVDYSMVNLNSTYCFIGKTDEENSLVCLQEEVPENTIEREGISHTGNSGFLPDRHSVRDFNAACEKQHRHLCHIYVQHRLYPDEGGAV